MARAVSVAAIWWKNMIWNRSVSWRQVMENTTPSTATKRRRERARNRRVNIVISIKQIKNKAARGPAILVGRYRARRKCQCGEEKEVAPRLVSKS